MSTSANRTSINFCQNYDGLVKSLKRGMIKHPGYPAYEIMKIEIKEKSDKSFAELTESNAEDIKFNLTNAKSFSLKTSFEQRVIAKIFVDRNSEIKAKKVSYGQVDLLKDHINVQDDVENQENNPRNSQRSTTPNKTIMGSIFKTVKRALTPHTNKYKPPTQTLERSIDLSHSNLIENVSYSNPSTPPKTIKPRQTPYSPNPMKTPSTEVSTMPINISTSPMRIDDNIAKSVMKSSTKHYALPKRSSNIKSPYISNPNDATSLITWKDVIPEKMESEMLSPSPEFPRFPVDNADEEFEDGDENDDEEDDEPDESMLGDESMLDADQSICGEMIKVDLLSANLIESTPERTKKESSGTVDSFTPKIEDHLNMASKLTQNRVDGGMKASIHKRSGSYSATKTTPVIDLKASVQTAAERQRAFESSFRQYSTNGKNKPTPFVVAGKASIPKTTSSVTPNPTRKKSHAMDAQSPTFSPPPPPMSSTKRCPEGRPSIGTMTTQWEFMRSNFVNNSDEELEWLMVSKRSGAYKYAHKRHTAAEDRYFKALYDIDVFEKKLKPLSGFNAKIPTIINRLTKLQNLSNPNDPTLPPKIIEAHQELKQYCITNGFYVDGHEGTPLFTVITQAVFIELLNCDHQHSQRMVNRARTLSTEIEKEIKDMQVTLTKARKELDDSLRSMEKWAKRESEADEYAQMIRDEELEWLRKEIVANQEALRLMRTLIPVNVAELSIAALIESFKEHDGRMTLELATELKNNKLLHWIVTHLEDIATANFLYGDKKTYFDNIECLDIIELRALSVCMPSKFEFDNDGKKAEWRMRFMNRVKQLVSQQNGEKMKGAWDPTIGKRNMVELPGLKPEQLRRPVYFYRTKEQSDVRVKQYVEKEELLKKKEASLLKATEDAMAAKKEYDTILVEMRDPDFKALYGMEKLSHVKEVAKNEWLEADRRKKMFTQDIERLKKSMQSAAITKEQFVAFEADVSNYLQEKGFQWSDLNQLPILIIGKFDPDIEVKKLDRSNAAKFSSAEQDAELRKQELYSIKTRKDEPPAVDPSVGTVSIGSDIEQHVESLSTTTTTSTVTNMMASTCKNSTTIGDVVSSDDVILLNVEGMTNNFLNHPGRTPLIIRKNPELAKTLNNLIMTSPNNTSSQPSMTRSMTPTSRAHTPNRRGTVATTITTATASDQSISAIPKEIKKSQSKLLQKLLQVARDVSPKRFSTSSSPTPSARFAMTLPSNGGQSFLSQLRQHSKDFGTEANGNDVGSGTNSGKPPSFLDQIKNRSNGMKNQPNQINLNQTLPIGKMPSDVSSWIK